MKTIRKGKKFPSKPWVGKKVRCSNCDFSGKLEPGDKVRFVSDQRDGDFYQLRCPNCKAFIILAASLRD